MTEEEHGEARERKGRAFGRSAARERRWRRNARPCDTASSHCGSPGAARSARRDGRRTNAGRRRQWPSPHCLHPKSDGPHFGLRQNGDAPGNRGVDQGLLTRRRFGFGDAPVPNQGIAVEGERRRCGACRTRRSGSRQTAAGIPRRRGSMWLRCFACALQNKTDRNP